MLKTGIILGAGGVYGFMNPLENEMQSGNAKLYENVVGGS